MTNDIGRLTARSREFTVDGRTYRLHVLRIEDWGEMQRWLDAQQPDPLAVARETIATGEWSLSQQQYLLKTAMELASRPKPRVGTPEAAGMLDSIEGRVEMLYLSVRRGDPAFSRQDAARLFDAMSADDQSAAIEHTEAAAMLDPKAPSPSGPASTTATSASGGNGAASSTTS